MTSILDSDMNDNTSTLLKDETMSTIPSWAYQVDSFDPRPDDELVCSVCQAVFQEPVKSACNHVFCRVCISTWLQNSRTCPICRKYTTMCNLSDVVPLVKNIIMKLTLRCPNFEKGCDIKFTLETCEKHVEECQYETVLCKNSECNESLLRKYMVEHETKKCSYRFSLCGMCSLKVLEATKSHDCVEALKRVVRKKDRKINQLEKKYKSLMEENARIRHRLGDSDLEIWETDSSMGSDIDLAGSRPFLSAIAIPDFLQDPVELSSTEDSFRSDDVNSLHVNRPPKRPSNSSTVAPKRRQRSVTCRVFTISSSDDDDPEAISVRPATFRSVAPTDGTRGESSQLPGTSSNTNGVSGTASDIAARAVASRGSHESSDESIRPSLIEAATSTSGNSSPLIRHRTSDENLFKNNVFARGLSLPFAESSNDSMSSNDNSARFISSPSTESSDDSNHANDISARDKASSSAVPSETNGLQAQTRFIRKYRRKVTPHGVEMHPIRTYSSLRQPQTNDSGEFAAKRPSNSSELPLQKSALISTRRESSSSDESLPRSGLQGETSVQEPSRFGESSRPRASSCLRDKASETSKIGESSRPGACSGSQAQATEASRIGGSSPPPTVEDINFESVLYYSSISLGGAVEEVWSSSEWPTSSEESIVQSSLSDTTSSSIEVLMPYSRPNRTISISSLSSPSSFSSESSRKDVFMNSSFSSDDF